MQKAITCPKCSFKFSLDEALNRDLELALRQELSASFQKKEGELRRELETELNEKAARQVCELEIKLATQANELKESREQERALLRVRSELEERAEKSQLEAERKLAHQRERIRKLAQEEVFEQYRLKEAEKTKLLGDLRQQIEELKRRSEPSSQQLLGDVQEIELEKVLRERFPRDVIEPIKTGARGADILQKVISDTGQLCGTVLWESKRVRNWSERWVDKLLEDKQAAQADVAVIVTGALPEEVLHLGSMRGVLLSTFALAGCLAETLRVNLALLGRTRAALSGQDDQKSRVFHYLSSPQFHDRIAAMAEHFAQMQVDLGKERAAMHRIWSKREKQIETILLNTAKFTGELEGLAGSSLPALPQFPLPAEVEDQAA